MGGKRSWARMVRGFQREYPHQVRLKYPFGWRSAHVAHVTAHLSMPKDWRWWTEGNDIDGTGVNVYGFKSQLEAEAFQLWADTCGIDWNARSDHQEPLPAPEKPEGHTEFAAHLFVGHRKS